MKNYTVAVKTKRMNSQSFKSLIRTFLIVLIVLLLLFPSLRYAMESVRVKQEQYRELQSLERELERLKAENKKRREIIEKLNQPEFIEMLARQKFGLVKPGEKLYIVIKPENKDGKSDKSSLEFEKDLLDLTKSR